MKASRVLTVFLTSTWLLGPLPDARAGVPADGFVLNGRLPTDPRQVRGSWSAADGVLSQTAAGAEAQLLLIGDPEWNDYTARASVQFKELARGAEAGLVLQAADLANYLAFTLVRRRSGVYAVVRIETSDGAKLVGDQSHVPDAAPSKWHEMRADVHGTQVSCFVDGRAVAGFDFAGTPPAYNTHGKTWARDPDRGRTGLINVNTSASFKDFRIEPLKDSSGILTPQRGARDASGMLLPRQSYAATMKAFTDWMLRSDEIVDKSKAPQAIRHLPPYLLTNFVAADDQLWIIGGEYAFNHALLITGSVQYYLFSGDDKYLGIARQVADWHIANRTPADWKFPHAPPSVVNFKPDGKWEGQDWGLEVDKSSYVGVAYLKLFAATGDEKYRRAADDIASTLRRHQQVDGSWPFRINAQTGEVKQGYACSQLWHVWFFTRLADLGGGDADADRQRARRALTWLLDNPVKTNKWVGLYGDIPSGSESLDQWVALETAMHVLDHRDEVPDALKIAQGIMDFVQKRLVVDYGFHRGVPGVLEQSDYKIVLTHHQLRLAELYAKLFEATGDAAYKRSAIETANSVTWCLMSDGKMRQGFWAHAVACPLVLSFNEQFSRIMSCIPETAPKGEDHLLQSSSDVKSVRYQPQAISYETVTAGEEKLVVRKPPAEVRADGKPLPRRDALRPGEEGWTYANTGLLRIRHLGPKVEISLLP